MPITSASRSAAEPREAHHRRAADELGEVGRNLDPLSGHWPHDSPLRGAGAAGARKRAGPPGDGPSKRLPGASRYSDRYFLHFSSGRRHRSPVREEERALGLPGALALLRRDDQAELLLALLDASSGVFVLTVPTDASGALGSVLIGGIVEVEVVAAADCILQTVTNVGPRSGNTYTRIVSLPPPLKIVSFAFTGSVTTGFA